MEWRRYRFAVLSIDINGIGGVCRWEGESTATQESVVAWGGVLAQAALLVLAEVASQIVPFRSGTAWGQFALTLVGANVWLMAVNLLPFPPLDGAKAWALFRWSNLHFWGRRSVLKVRAAAVEAELRRLRADDPAPDAKAPKSRTLH